MMLRNLFLLPILFLSFVGGLATLLSAQSNVHARGNFTNAFLQFEKGGKGRVAFIGGSITEMNGYRPMVCELLQKRFPKTEFTFISAGISSTCSTTGAARLSRDVLGEGPIDLFFIEFAVNDDQDAHHTREECIRGMEGIIRQTRNRYPHVDIVVTYFVNEGMLEKFAKGEVPLTIEAHEEVAKHYGVPSIHLAKEVAERIQSKSLTWKEFGGVHPAPLGNGIAAKMIEELFNKVWLPESLALKQRTAHLQPTMLDTRSYSDGRFIDPQRAMRGDGWNWGIPEWETLAGSKRPRFTNIPMLFGDKIGAELQLDFEGRAIGAFISAGPDAGVVESSIDGAPFQKTNLFHPYSQKLHYPRTVIFSDQLEPGNHRLVLRISKETHSDGHAIRIMQFFAN